MAPRKTKKQSKTSQKYTTMLDAYRAFWHRGFIEWAGTSSRSEYWWAALANFIIACGAWILSWMFLLINPVLSGVVLTLWFAYVIAAVVPGLSMTTRRMHDAGLSAWCWLILLFGVVPWIGEFISSVAMLVIALLPTQDSGNPYHKNNK